MTPKLFRTDSYLIGCALEFAAACADMSTSPVTPVQAAGVYELASVTGRGPSSGTMTLGADGTVERSVQYAWLAPQTAYSAVGTYTLDAQGIAFSLREGTSSGFYVWPVRGEWQGSGFTIRYPDPADGPDIIETYARR